MLDKNYKYTYWLKVPFLDFFFKKILYFNRQKIHEIFIKESGYNLDSSLLDIGTSNTDDTNHNLILQKTVKNKNIYSLSNTNLDKIKLKYGNVKKFYKADGRNTGLTNKFFDIVYSSATLEHVGSFEEQIQFIKEAYRLSKKITFITTPNRFYPIDFHTKIPLIHWFPKKIHRFILNLLGLSFYAKESNLNLLDVKTIIKIINILKIKNYKIVKHSFLFFNSNIIIILKKNDVKSK